MPDEPYCLLRRLNICDANVVVGRLPGRYDPCYCLALVDAQERNDQDTAMRVRTDRARAVARSGELEHIRDQRERLAELETRARRDW